MKRISLATLLLCVLPLLRAAPALPPRAEVLATMERVADWQLAHPYTKAPATDWINAAFYTGLLAVDQVSPSPRYREALRGIAERTGWEPGPRTYHADDLCVGQAYLGLYSRYHDPRMIAPLRARLDFILAHPKSGSLAYAEHHLDLWSQRWSWCDALFMAPPVWTRMSEVTGDPRYRLFMESEWKVTTDYLYDREAHLYYRDSRFFDRREPNGAKVFWSRGNGWVIAGITRVLEALPADDPARPGFERQFREMAAAVLAAQQPDGMWRTSLLDPRDYTEKESSGTGFYCYALAWGVNHGLLDRGVTLPAVERAWQALEACVKPDGKLTRVQTVAGSPTPFDPDSTMPYGVGAFLLAGRQVYALAR
ncbi:unsaturated rhamnogalacturonyl hydrolase YteR [mine drainage metagenome]|uniref:Unsaturated rhamnogalacturonyl hydrolase YteR n=1 Tax=mine drainage metagenome TaxID=410659 RepID=A0A1J5TAX3_9ZZZZ